MQYKNLSFDHSINNLGLITGYASVFNVLDGHRDLITNGAFKNLDLSKIKFLWQHEAKYPVGKIKSIKEDEFGLYIEAYLNLNLNKAREAYELIKMDALSGLSIGFNPSEFRFDDQGNRIITKIDLWEVSIVTFPANKDAQIINHKKLSQALAELGISIDGAIKTLVPGKKYA